MSNSLLTLGMITRQALRLWKNSNAFIQNINRQYDDEYAVSGAKIGSTLKIRLPNDFVVTTGSALAAQDTVEQSTTLVVSTQKHVDVSFNSVDRTLSLDDYSERILAPMVNNLAGAVAADVMSGVEGGVCNYVANTGAGGAVQAPSADTVLSAGVSLTNNSAPLNRRRLVADPQTMARTVSALSGLFNPTKTISRQFESAQIYDALNFAWFEDQTAIKHTTGSFSAGTVNGAGQTGLSLTVNPITGTLNKGDIITVAGVSQVNRITKISLQQPRQFVVTANVAAGATSIPIYPAIVPPVGGNPVQYQTVDASPANGAAITLAHNASEVHRRNIAYAPEAVTLVTADLYTPSKGVEEAARAVFDNISMRMLTQYVIGTDQLATRLDVLYGYAWLRPEWAVVIGDAV